MLNRNSKTLISNYLLRFILLILISTVNNKLKNNYVFHIPNKNYFRNVLIDI